MRLCRQLLRSAWLGCVLSQVVLGQVPETPTATPDLRGQWRNDRGSTLEFTVSGRLLHGSYRTAVGRASHAHAYPLRGFQNGDLVAFCVDWGDPEKSGPAASSVSCWVGQHTIDPISGEGQIHSQWHLSRDLPDNQEADDLWESVLTGSSVFRRLPVADNPAQGNGLARQARPP